MDDKIKFNETVSDMSVQDILDEINAESIYGDDTLSVDEILAEFSDGTKRQLEITSSREEQNVKQKKRSSKKIIQAEGQISFDCKDWKDIERELEEQAEKEILSAEKNKPKMIDTIVRPWENGVYGDMSLENTQEKTSKKKKRSATFAETFDTFTRSELFEDKNKETEIETRSVEEIIKENTKLAKLLGLRSILLMILSVISCYLAFSEPLGWFIPGIFSYLKHPFRYLFLTAFFQICAMLLSVDVLSRGMARIFRLKPDAESAITFSSFASLVHVISIMAVPRWGGWLPYSCITVVGLFFAIYGKWINARALCRVGKTVKAAKCPEAVRVENIYGEMHIIKQTTEDTKSFVSHISDKDASCTFWRFLSPVVIVSSIVFAFLSSVGTGNAKNFFWMLAGISSVSTPFFTMLSFSFPFSVTAKSLASVGAAISGWFSASNLAKKANLVVCDDDIFPKGSVVLHGLKVLGKYSLEQTICYAASVIAETGCGLTDVFSDLLKSRYGTVTKVTNLQYCESGGIEAEIGEDSVLVGSAGFMLRSGVRLVSGTGAKNAVFIAVNKTPAGVFNINYKENADVERALHMLIKRKVPVVLAVRDFNLLPMMVEQSFGLRDGSLEYPEIEQRVDLSEKEQFVSSDTSAIITRGGLYPLSAAVLSAKKLRRATIRNIFLTTACAIIGMLLMFYLMFIQKPILVTPQTVFVYLLLWCIPMYMLSIRVKQ